MIGRRLLGLIALALTACASTAVREPPAPLTDFPSDYRVREAWSADIGTAAVKGYLRLTPRVVEGFVYTADARGKVSAFSTDNGERKWSVDLAVPISGAVGVAQNLILVGTRRGEVIALDRETGKQLWSSPVSSEILAPPAGSGDTIVAQTVDGRLFGFAAGDGKRQWVYERTEPALSLRGTDTPIVVADAVVAGFASGKLVALRLRDGALLWEASVSQPRGRNEIERLVDVDAPPLVLPDAVYAANYQGKLVAINPQSGAVLWSRDVSTYTGLASDGANIYLTDAKSHVLAFDRASGAVVWKQEGLRGRGLNAPVFYRDFIVVADGDGYVHWLSREDGRFIARYQVGSDPIRAPGAIAGDTILIAGTGGTLAALQLAQKK